MYGFRYRRPTAIAAARDAFEQAQDGQFLAGGQTLLPVMKQRLAAPSDLIDLAGIGELQGISLADKSITIGAMTTHAQVAAAGDVRHSIPALAALAGCIGDPHVRNRGTLGGSLANNDPSADYPAAIVALGATVHTDQRQIAGDEFFTGFFETALHEGELITRVEFAIPDSSAYEKFENSASRYAVVGVFVSRGSLGVRVAVTGAGPCVFRMPELEAELTRNFNPGVIERFPIAAADCNADLHASAEYRAHLVGVMAARAVTTISGGE